MRNSERITDLESRVNFLEDVCSEILREQYKGKKCTYIKCGKKFEFLIEDVKVEYSKFLVLDAPRYSGSYTHAVKINDCIIE